MMKSFECYPVTPQKQEEVPVVNGHITCVKRDPDSNMFNLALTNTTFPDNCPTDYKSCNEGGGKKDHVFCVNVNATCPVTDLSYTEEIWSNDTKRPELLNASEPILSFDSSMGAPLVNLAIS